MGLKKYCILLAFIILPPTSNAELSFSQSDTLDQLKSLSLEALMDVHVTSVTRKKQRLADSAAAVYVISQEDIRRSGHQSLPEILRMAPGLHVAQIDSSKWAVSSRGFNGRFANKLLILMDGRILYSPLFSGVYWDVQNMVLEDIERIEIIRGPGATLWGANAVNGVINIISKSTTNTQSTLLGVGTGTNENYSSVLRYGAKIDAYTSYRIYAKSFHRKGGVFFKNENSVHSNWKDKHLGFKLETELTDSDSITFQGDWYTGSAEQNIYQPTRTSGITIADEADTQGGNILADWKHRWSDSSGINLKVYFDQTKRKNRTLEEKRDTFVIDFQSDYILSKQQIVWGLGYKQSADNMVKPINSVLSFVPRNRKSKTFSAYIQDDISYYNNRLHLIIGSKYEHNDYTGDEIQPNIRLLWSPDEKSSLWMAVSKAARTPSRMESDVIIEPGGPVIVYGSSNYSSEDLLAFELGYRVYPKKNIYIDIAGFINHYDKLRTIETSDSPIPPIDLLIENKMDGKTYGLEIALNWNINQDWQLNSSYSWLHSNFYLKSDSSDSFAIAAADNTPEHQFQLHSLWDLPKDLELDTAFYYSGKLPNSDIDSYSRFDLRLGWQLNKNLQSSIAIQNIFDDKHPEFIEFSGISLSRPQGLISTQAERNLHVKFTWQF
jgi:iron complex outermembrane recepter protein